MENHGTLLITGREVASLLSIGECIVAVEDAFRMLAEGKVPPPGMFGIHANGGGFHVKTGMMKLARNYFVVKTNANFPDNMKAHGLPTIQGIVSVLDGDNGRLLALMDTIAITIIRTGAATGIAAKYLSRQDSRIATICGCGNQGRISLQALISVRKLDTVFVYDIDHSRSDEMARDMTTQDLRVIAVDDFRPAVGKSDICVTCTPSKTAFLDKDHVRPGTFIAAVGTDNDFKQELTPALLASGKVVVDLLEQAATAGDLHHALAAGVLTRSDVWTELGEIIAGNKPGRTSENEIIIFDSTGMALQDVAAASIVYEKALAAGFKRRLAFA